MYKIIEKVSLKPKITKMEVHAPHIANKALAGQFIILRINEKGERIPLTIHDTNKTKGTVTVVFQEVGKTTIALGQLSVGDDILDFVGPLGNPSEFENPKKAVIIGGGLGCAIAYPQAKALSESGTETHVITGFRNKDFVILEDKFSEISKNLFIMTDDGTYGEKGFVTEKLSALLENGNMYDLCVCIGPLPMMRAVAEITRPYGIKTIVSMNSIMIDGTGMCGGCRVTVDGQVKFACVDGPDFDAHLINFDEAINRLKLFEDKERISLENHRCKLGGKGMKI